MKGVTQEELATELGVNESTVFHYEKNDTKPLRRTMEKLTTMLATVESWSTTIKCQSPGVKPGLFC
jgi:DNA-binding XRE family transcriptional regulator